MTVSDNSEMDVDIPETPEPLDPREPEVGDELESNPENETPVESTEPTPTVETTTPAPSTKSRCYPSRQHQPPNRFDSQTW